MLKVETENKKLIWKLPEKEFCSEWEEMEE